MMLLCLPLLILHPTPCGTLILFKEVQGWFQCLGENCWRRPASCGLFSQMTVSGSFLDQNSPGTLLPRAQNVNPFQPIEYLAYEIDPSLNMRLFVGLEMYQKLNCRNQKQQFHFIILFCREPLGAAWLREKCAGLGTMGPQGPLGATDSFCFLSWSLVTQVPSPCALFCKYIPFLNPKLRRENKQEDNKHKFSIVPPWGRA